MGDTATAFRPVAGKRPAPAERPEPPAFPSRRRKAGRRHTRRGSAAEPGPGAGGGKPGRLPRPLEEGVGRCPARDAGLLVPAAPARRDAARSSSSGLPEGSAQSRGGRLRAATKAAGGGGLLGEAATGLPPPVPPGLLGLCARGLQPRGWRGPGRVCRSGGSPGPGPARTAGSGDGRPGQGPVGETFCLGGGTAKPPAPFKRPLPLPRSVFRPERAENSAPLPPPPRAPAGG